MGDSIALLSNNLYKKMNKDIQKVSIVLILLLSLHNVQAKAVGRNPKHLSFQGFDHSQFRYGPQIISIAEHGTDEISKGFNQYVPLIDGKPIYIGTSNSEQIPERSYDQQYDGKYDLTYHESLDQVFQSPESSNSHQLQGKEQSSVVETNYRFQDLTLNGNDPDPLKDDQVFIHKKAEKRRKHQSIVQATKPSDFRKYNLHRDEPNRSSSESDVICDSRSSLKNEPLTESKQVYEIEIHNELDLQSDTSTSSSVTTDQNTIKFSTLSPQNEVNEPLREIAIQEIDAKFNNEPLENFQGDIDQDNEEKADQLNMSQSSVDSSEPGLNFGVDVNIPNNSLVSTIESEERNLESDPPQVSQKENSNDAIDSEEDPKLLRDEVKSMFETSFRSFVFNPQAKSEEKFQACKTPKNESGNCRYIQHCLLPSVLSSIQHFVENACVIEERFIGVCCPEFPAQTVFVNWPDELNNLNIVDTPVKVPVDCGIGLNTRVVGGTNAGRRAWPWMVALLNNRNKFYCGGALINDRYVLTASHCTFGASSNQIIARLGEFDFKDDEPHTDYLVTEIKRHGQYTRITLRNDIALLKLEKPVVLNEFVNTICLPEAGKDYIGKTATLAGWGHIDGGFSDISDVLQEASFPIIENSECAVTHGIPVSESLICAAATEKNKGACNGDSGGPLMLLDDDGRWKAIGIVSWGRRGCNPSFPTVYTRVNQYLDWIKKHSN